MNKKENLLNGIIPPMITPLTEEQKIDEKSTRKVVDHLINGGVHTLFILGSTGEGPLLPLDSQYKLTKIVVDQVENRVPVIAGVSEPSTQRVLEVINKLSTVDIDGVVSTLPFYDLANGDEQFSHFKIIAENSPLPVVIYDIPSRVGNRIEKSVLYRLFKLKNIIGLKDSTGDLRRFRQMVEECSDLDISFALGHSDMIDISIYFGGDGVVPSDAHLYPELCVEIYEFAINGQWKKAAEVQKRLDNKRIEIYSQYPEYYGSAKHVCKLWLKDQGIVSHTRVVDPF